MVSRVRHLVAVISAHKHPLTHCRVALPNIVSLAAETQNRIPFLSGGPTTSRPVSNRHRARTAMSVSPSMITRQLASANHPPTCVVVCLYLSMTLKRQARVIAESQVILWNFVLVNHTVPPQHPTASTRNRTLTDKKTRQGTRTHRTPTHHGTRPQHLKHQAHVYQAT